MKLKLILFILLLPFVASAATNQFSDIIVYRTTTTSNIHVRGYVGVNTNVTSGSDAIVIRNPPGQPGSYITMQDDGNSPSAGIQFGNIADNYMLIDADGSNPPDLRISLLGASPGDLIISATGVNGFRFSPSTSLNTYGHGASSAHTFNGSTITFNHNAVVNGGILTIPVAGTGTVSNSTSFTTLNTLTASNIVDMTTLAVGTNTTGSAQVLIQGTAANFTNLVIRAHSAQTSDLINGFNPAGTIAFRVQSNGTINWGGSSAVANATANTITLNSTGTLRTTTANADIILAGGAGGGGDVVFQPNAVEKAMVTSDGLLLGTNGQPGKVGVSWWGATNFTWTPGSVTLASGVATNMSMSGAQVGFPISIGHSVDRLGLVWSAACTNAGVVTVSINNVTAGNIDPGVHEIRVRQTVGPQ